MSVLPTPEIVSFIKNKAKVLSPDFEGEIGNIDYYLNSKYNKEANFKLLISLFSIISILLSLMGTFSLVIFNFKFRIKEIGIRKVEGAALFDVLVLLNKGYIKLIALSFL